MQTYKIHYRNSDSANNNYVLPASEQVEAESPQDAIKRFIARVDSVKIEVIEGCGRQAHKTYFVAENSKLIEI
jgi:hypothetical protein